MRVLSKVANAVVMLTGVGVAGVTACSAYLGALTVVAARSKPAVPRLGAVHTRRFVIVVPAHDESAVIARALQAFDQLAYPRDCFEVHVVADNCSDDTADVVRALGHTVHERVDAVLPGKGHALNWLTDRLVAAENPFDAIAVVDADTTVDPQFLAALDDAMSQGALAVQGFYAVREPTNTTATALRHAALACRHHLRPLGRTAIGASSGLYGNGMAFDRSLLEGHRWSGHLVEDAEFQIELLLDGHRVQYVPLARVEAEMPDQLDAAASQNERWELGRLQLARRYLPTLVRRTVTGPRGQRLATADAAMDQLVPPLSVLVASNALLAGVNAVGAFGGHGQFHRRCLVLSTLSLIAVAGHVVVALRAIHAPSSVYRSLLSAPRLIVWKVGLWLRVLSKPDTVSWTRTERNADR